MVDHDESAGDVAPSGTRVRRPVDTIVFEPDEVLRGQLETVLRRLLKEFGGKADPQTIGREFARAFAEHRKARIRTYVAIFTYRSAREALRRRAASSAA